VIDHLGATYPVTADPWWNPFSWNWSKIGKAFISSLTTCLGGAAKATLGIGAGTVTANVAAKIVSGKLMVQVAGGPWGYFAVAAGGCIYDLLG